MSKILGYTLISIQVLDILTHVLTNQFEMIRVISNFCVIGWVLLQFTSFHRRVFNLLTSVTLSIYIILNALFIFENGLINLTTQSVRLPLILFVSLTLLLMIVLIIRRTYEPKRM